LLYSQIGDSVDDNGNLAQGINGASFAYEMQYLQDKCKSISVRINSVGGSVLEGYSIVSAILNSKVPCNTYIDGLAASISGVIAMAGKKCYMMDYGTLMLHNPSGGDSKMLDLVKETLVTLISNRCGKTMDEISTMMDSETWLSANECLSNNLVDEVISSGKKIKMNKSESLYNMTLIYNKLINPKTKTMIKVTDFLKLKNEASEEEIVSAIEEKDNVLVSKDAEILELKEKLKAFTDAEELAKEAAIADMKNKANDLVNKAFEDKKIKEEEKESLVNLAISNFETIENMLSKINVVKNAVTVFDFKVTKEDGSVENRSEWSFNDWLKNDNKGLTELQNSNPEEFEKLVKKLKVTI
jgi:ATP-dependent protease ClpP protease subunit